MSPRPLLTERQEEVLLAVSDGLTNIEAADYLGISPRAVHWHITRLRKKFGVEHKRELIVAARGYFLPR